MPYLAITNMYIDPRHICSLKYDNVSKAPTGCWGEMSWVPTAKVYFTQKHARVQLVCNKYSSRKGLDSVSFPLHTCHPDLAA